MVRKNKNILVFGAAGFIGTYLIEELTKRYHVVASDISKSGSRYYKGKKIPFVTVDITKSKDFRKLSQEKFDIVIHLAAWQPANVGKQNQDPKKYIDVNVNGTLNILEFCRSRNIPKLIYATSHRNTQGLWSVGKPISEKDGRAIKYSGEYSLFSISETAAQDCIQYYCEEYGLGTVILRLPPVYGYGPHTEIFKEGKPIKTGFQTFIDKAKANKPIEIWGDASKGRDIIYIKDVVTAFLKTIENKKAQGLYNISSGRSLTLKEEAETIAKVFWDSKSEPQFVFRQDKPNHIVSFVYDIQKAKNELNWSPVYSFEDMLLDYIEENNQKRFQYLIEKRKKMFGQNRSK